jgi:hypothetical protein
LEVTIIGSAARVIRAVEVMVSEPDVRGMMEER